MRALGWIHSKGIIHCDIRPENFLLGQLLDGRAGVVLIDFEASGRTGEVRVGEAEHRGDMYFASPHLLQDRKRRSSFFRLPKFTTQSLSDPCIGDDLVSLAYVLAHIARYMTLSWESDYLEVVRHRPTKPLLNSTKRTSGWQISSFACHIVALTAYHLYSETFLIRPFPLHHRDFLIT